MADPRQQQPQQLRAAVTLAQKDLRLAGVRLAEAERAHRLHGAGPCPAACSDALRGAADEQRFAEERLDSARIDLENFEEDEREQDADADPMEPQGDYMFWEIVAKLYHWRQRATYGAVGELRGASALMVREWIKAPAVDNSFVVQVRTGEPSGYPSDAIHPQLKKHTRILTTGKELLEWLRTHKLVIR